MKICAWCFRFTAFGDSFIAVTICHRCHFKLTHPVSEWPKDWLKPKRQPPKEVDNGKKNSN